MGIRKSPRLLHTETERGYAPLQAFARERDTGSNSIIDPSARSIGGECRAAFSPQVIARPV
jgi:hypothetical protein